MFLNISSPESHFLVSLCTAGTTSVARKPTRELQINSPKQEAQPSEFLFAYQHLTKSQMMCDVFIHLKLYWTKMQLCSSSTYRSRSGIVLLKYPLTLHGSKCHSKPKTRLHVDGTFTHVQVMKMTGETHMFLT